MTGPGQRMMPQQAPPMNGHRPGGLPAAALSTRTRPKGYAALAVALIVGLGALGYYFYTTAGAKVAVVVAVADIPVGHTIATPSAAYRRFQPMTAGLLNPTRRTISFVPTPSAASSTTLARCASPARSDGERVHDVNNSRSQAET